MSDEVKKKFPFKWLLLLAVLAILAPILYLILHRRPGVPTGQIKITTLTQVAFQPLPLGSVKPAGWLLEQMKLQAGGLSGHLDEFWPDIKDSGWIGGKAEGWERAPYWLDGVIPLAYLTDDPKLKAKVVRWVDYILKHQLPDGWLGPEQSPPPWGSHGESPNPRDPWPQFIILKALAQYEEATEDPRVIPAMKKNLQCLDAQLDRIPLYAWNYFRWEDLWVSLFWVYDRDPEPWLLEMAIKVANQGYNWPKHFTNLPVKEKSQGWNWAGHVVNNAMGLKTDALMYRLTGKSAFQKLALDALDELDRYHGEANGLMSGDECLAGKSPSQGTELCAIVETMFSMETSLSVLGNVEFADRLEKIGYNALPAAFTADYWHHQYVEQANQIISGIFPNPIYATVSPEANLFGLEPNFGCCTANMHQGWPKLASHLWMRSPDGGLAAAIYAPSVVETELSGSPVRIELETDYPFSEDLLFKVKVSKPLEFPLYLRVPEWAKGATLKLPDGKTQNLKSGAFHKLVRQWNGEETMVLHLPMTFKVRAGYQNSVSLERGPLVYSLGLKEQWKVVRPFRVQPPGNPQNDLGALPESPWNYALVLDRDHPEKSLIFQGGDLKGNPFTLEGAPIHVTVKGRLLESWGLDQGAAMPPPQSPVESTQPLEDLTLVPYGSTRLRVTEFPVLK
jgi:uncharacterized protein